MKLSIRQRSSYLGNDSWRWSVWLDGSSVDMSKVDHVVWHLHPTFSPPIRSVSDRSTGFRLSARGWGTFELRAVIYGSNSETPMHSLSHHLELHYWRVALFGSGGLLMW